MLLATLSPILTSHIHSLACLEPELYDKASELADQLNLPVESENTAHNQLCLSSQGLAIHIPELGKPILIDFSSGKYDHRRKFGGGRGQPLAKAVGLKQGQSPTVIDATAGFARDAFVLASLGCQVTMLEQNTVLAVLIADALERAHQNNEIVEIIERMQIHHANAVSFLNHNNTEVDVIYMDPMYPSRDKSARVKKDMQLLHELVGADTDSAELLRVARQCAGRRVVVKRPKGAEYVGGQTPTASVTSKNTRFDIYPTI